MPWWGKNKNNNNDDNNDGNDWNSGDSDAHQWTECDASTCKNEYHWRVIDGQLVHDPTGVGEYSQGLLDGSLTHGIGDLPKTPEPEEKNDNTPWWKQW